MIKSKYWLDLKNVLTWAKYDAFVGPESTINFNTKRSLAGFLPVNWA